MEKSKKIVLICIIVVIALIFIAGGTFAYIYFFTDAFKTNQELFYKYLSKNKEIVEFFKDEDILKYYEEKKNNSYNDNGEISISLTGDVDESVKSQADIINKSKITYTGGVNGNNKYSNQDIKLLYNNDEVIGGTFTQKNDYYGLKINNIIEKYITFENNNLKEFAKNLGMSEEQINKIPNKITKEVLKGEEFVSEEQLNTIINRYINVVIDNLKEDSFSKNNSEEGNIYTLTINQQTAITVINSLIETLKNDEEVLNIIKQIYIKETNVTEEESQMVIEQLKTYLQETQNNLNQTQVQEDSNNIYISVYVSKRKLVKTEVIVGEKEKIILSNGKDTVSMEVQEDSQNLNTYTSVGIITVEKNKTENELSYNLTVKGKEGKELGKATVNYTGLSELSNVQENLLIDIYYIPNDILSSVQQNEQNTEISLEKDRISLAMTELVNKMYEDQYINNKETEINEKTIKEQLDKQKLSTTVSRNEDGTFSVVSNSTGITYTVTLQGQVTYNEPVQETEPTEEKTMIISLNLKNTNTFGEVTEQSFDINNMYVINNRKAEELQNMFDQLNQRVINQIMTYYQSALINNSINGEAIQSQTNNTQIDEQTNIDTTNTQTQNGISSQVTNQVQDEVEEQKNNNVNNEIITPTTNQLVTNVSTNQ